MNVYHEGMSRTNVVVDERLLERVMKLYGLRTKRDAIDYALRRTLAASDDPHARALALEGSGWEGELEQLRSAPIATL